MSEGFRLRLRFDDGTTGEVDLSALATQADAPYLAVAGKRPEDLFSGRALGLTVEWAAAHRDEPPDLRDASGASRPLRRIAPLS